jgi:hypothetical protein
MDRRKFFAILTAAVGSLALPWKAARTTIDPDEFWLSEMCLCRNEYGWLSLDVVQPWIAKRLLSVDSRGGSLLPIPEAQANLITGEPCHGYRFKFQVGGQRLPPETREYLERMATL